MLGTVLALLLAFLLSAMPVQGGGMTEHLESSYAELHKEGDLEDATCDKYLADDLQVMSIDGPMNKKEFCDVLRLEDTLVTQQTDIFKIFTCGDVVTTLSETHVQTGGQDLTKMMALDVWKKIGDDHKMIRGFKISAKP